MGTVPLDPPYTQSDLRADVAPLTVGAPGGQGSMLSLILVPLLSVVMTTAKAESDPYLLLGGFPYQHGLVRYPYTPTFATAAKQESSEAGGAGPVVLSYSNPYTPYSRDPVIKIQEGKPIISPLSSLRYPYHYIAKRSAESKASPQLEYVQAPAPYLAYGPGYGYPGVYGHYYGYGYHG